MELESYITDSEIGIICKLLNLNAIILHNQLDIAPPKSFMNNKKTDEPISSITYESYHYDISRG